MSEDLVPSTPADIPLRDAACVLVADLGGPDPRLLMGRRHADQVFLPDKWVFPGGRVEDDDRRFADQFDGLFSPSDLAAEIKPFALAGIRELFEETGLLIGGGPALFDAGPAWQPFAASGQMPAPSRIRPLARAITPPGRVRRYDTWFFLANKNSLSANVAIADGELLDLDWFTLPEAGNLDLPNITRLILNEAADVFRGARASGDPHESLPFYYSDGSVFRRELISCKVAPLMP